MLPNFTITFQYSTETTIIANVIFLSVQKIEVINNSWYECCGGETFLTFVFALFSGCHEQGYAGNIIVYGICVRSIDIRTRCSASHIQIDPSSGLACLNLLAMQPSTPISAYHHIMIIHTRTHNTITLWKYNIHIQPSSSILKLLESRASPLNQFPSSNSHSYSKGYKQIRNAIARILSSFVRFSPHCHVEWDFISQTWRNQQQREEGNLV